MGTKFRIKPIGLLTVFSILISIILFQNFTWNGSENLGGAKKCSADKIKEILAPSSANASSVKIDCSFNLRANDVVTKGLMLEGAAASGVSIDCNKGSLATVTITSIEDSSATQNYGYSRPEKILITACKFKGTVRVRGYGNNGEAPKVRESSRLDTNHTVRAQAVAPKNILIENSVFEANAGIPLYLAPGTTQVTIQNSSFVGSSGAVAIYMDAESGKNRIIQNKFDLKTAREIIAVDGSANNLITKNTFLPQGTAASIHIYRNCGEGGTVRHQAPTDNVISSNTFNSDVSESIYVGMRNGRSTYCDHDAGYKFGSSKDNRDLAENNKILGNTFNVNKGGKKKFISRFIIVSNYKTTEISRNKLNIESVDDLKFVERIYGAFTDGGGNALVPEKRKANKVVQFECVKSGSNGGCSKSVSCPDSGKIESVKAACNLEGTGLVTWNKVNALEANSIAVLKTSDHKSDGVCQVDGQQISEDEKTIRLSNNKSIGVSCREHDKNGGDCVIRGVLTCKS